MRLRPGRKQERGERETPSLSLPPHTRKETRAPRRAAPPRDLSGDLGTRIRELFRSQFQSSSCSSRCSPLEATAAPHTRVSEEGRVSGRRRRRRRPGRVVLSRMLFWWGGLPLKGHMEFIGG